MRGLRVSIVVPTLNEAGTIKPLLEGIDQALGSTPYEVIVVDDGSTDGTRAKAMQADANVRVILRDEGDGLASAVVEGIRSAQAPSIAVIDGDLQHPPALVARLLERAQETGADLVVGSRYVQGGAAPGFSPIRRFVSWGTRVLIRALVPSTRQVGLKDTTSGAFLFNKDRVDVDALDPSGYKILLEILQSGRFQRVEEVGYTFRERASGESNLTLGPVLATLQHLLVLAGQARENRRLAQFATVGASGAVVNLGLLAFLTEVVGLFYVVSAAIAIEASILSNFLFNDAWTFRDVRSGSRSSRLWRFNLVSLIGLSINLAVLSALTEILGLYYLASAAIAIGVAFIVNYGGNVGWTYLTGLEEGKAPSFAPSWPALDEGAHRLSAWTRDKLAPYTSAVSRDDESP